VYQEREAKEWSTDKNRLTNKAIDSKLIRLFVLKLIDVIESYNVNNNKNKINVKGASEHLHVFRMHEMFMLIATAFGKLKDEKDLIRERKHADLIKNFDSNGFSPNFADNLDLIKKILETCILDLPDKSKILNKLFESLEKISSAYKISAEYEEDFFMFILDEYQETTRKNQRKLGFWCFNPAYAFREFVSEKPRSIILASGTLTPMNTFDNELQM
jgi:Rad3-related DNA helicase